MAADDGEAGRLDGEHEGPVVEELLVASGNEGRHRGPVGAFDHLTGPASLLIEEDAQPGRRTRGAQQLVEADAHRSQRHPAWEQERQRSASKVVAVHAARENRQRRLCPLGLSSRRQGCQPSPSHRGDVVDGLPAGAQHLGHPRHRAVAILTRDGHHRRGEQAVRQAQIPASRAGRCRRCRRQRLVHRLHRVGPCAGRQRGRCVHCHRRWPFLGWLGRSQVATFTLHCQAPLTPPLNHAPDRLFPRHRRALYSELRGGDARPSIARRLRASGSPAGGSVNRPDSRPSVKAVNSREQQVVAMRGEERARLGSVHAKRSCGPPRVRWGGAMLRVEGRPWRHALLSRQVESTARAAGDDVCAGDLVAAIHEAAGQGRAGQGTLLGNDNVDHVSALPALCRARVK